MMKIAFGSISIIFLLLMSGCAHLDFGEKGLTYYDPKPYLLVIATKDCKITAAPLVLPGTEKAVKFVPGYGSAKLTVSLTNGMITQAGQDTDTQIPATISAIAGLGTAVSGIVKSKGQEPPECSPKALLYPIVSGVPDLKNPITIVIE
jgi:hypothetical protein